MVVDDGEAMSIAIAAIRGLELAIDDKQATNHARRAFPEMKLWTSSRNSEALDGSGANPGSTPSRNNPAD